MSELRQNLATKEWAVIAPERGKKPVALKSKVVTDAPSKNEYEPDCPFCPGNEKKFPVTEKDRIEKKDGNWIVRVIDNKYKVLDKFDTCPLVPDAFENEGKIKKECANAEN